MLKTRVIPVLLLRDEGLYKTVRFKDPTYIGDPMNCVRIFNEKEVDELIFLSINATRQNQAPNFKLIHDIATECFMPFSYGGGIRSMDDAERILSNGAEKVILNSILYEDLRVVEALAKRFGTQAVVASLDVSKSFLGGYTLYSHGGTVKQKKDLIPFIKDVNQAGVGEIMITSIDRDGTQKGYDISLLKSVTEATQLPVIVCGGAGSLDHMSQAVKDGKASAVAAGSFFVFHGKHRAVLITYPSDDEKKKHLE